MAAIITDQLRISLANSFIRSVDNEENYYYAFIGLPNSSDYDSNWDRVPLSPIDSFDNQNDIWDTILALKRINSEDVVNVIRKIVWSSGNVYDMYRHDISRNNPTNVTKQTSLYFSNFYVMNRDYRVYICLSNGTSPEYPNGKTSLEEPLFTDLEPVETSDGYVWKYLYTIAPNDILKFESIHYIPVPKYWESTNEEMYLNSNSSGQLKIVVIKDRGSNLGPANSYPDVDILGDGVGAKATVTVGNDSKIESVYITDGGSGYSHGKVDLETSGIIFGANSTLPELDVIIPPKGGHGNNIYRELGAHNVLIYARIENNQEDPDFTIGNKISRIGLIENPLTPNDSLLTKNSACSTYSLKLIGINSITDYETAVFDANAIIQQTIGVGATAYGKVVSYDNTTGVLKYWKDRTLSGFDTGTYNQVDSIYGNNVYEFTSTPSDDGNLVIQGGSINLQIDASFTGISTTSSINSNEEYNLGQTFEDGIALPEVKKYSGDILYIDNRPSITRSSNQKEDIKIVLQF